MWHIDDLRGQLGGSKWVRFTISFLCPGGSFYELKPRLTRGEGGRRVAGKEKFLQNEEQKSEWERGAEIRIRTRGRNLNQNEEQKSESESERGAGALYPLSFNFIHFNPLCLSLNALGFCTLQYPAVPGYTWMNMADIKNFISSPAPLHSLTL